MNAITQALRGRFTEKTTPHEQAQYARLERAEREVADLKARADRAVRFLDERRGRNHWREAIEQVVRGAY